MSTRGVLQVNMCSSEFFAFQMEKYCILLFKKHVQIMTNLSNSQGENEQRFRKAHGISNEDGKGTCRVCNSCHLFLQVLWCLQVQVFLLVLWRLSRAQRVPNVHLLPDIFFIPYLVKFIGNQVTRNIGYYLKYPIYLEI